MRWFASFLMQIVYSAIVIYQFNNYYWLLYAFIYNIVGIGQLCDWTIVQIAICCAFCGNGFVSYGKPSYWSVIVFVSNMLMKCLSMCSMRRVKRINSVSIWIICLMNYFHLFYFINQNISYHMLSPLKFEYYFIISLFIFYFSTVSKAPNHSVRPSSSSQ